jgi:DNA-binding LacI/PurR family transcriptional regulator
MAGMATPPLTTVFMQNERAGRVAIVLLVDLLVNLLTAGVPGRAARRPARSSDSATRSSRPGSSAR